MDIIENMKILEKLEFYDVHQERLSGSDSFMKVPRNKDGVYIGSLEQAEQICGEYGISPEISHHSNSICSIGWSERNQKWFGWSHRGICGFGIGSEIETGDSAASSGWVEDYLEMHPQDCRRLPVGFKAETLYQAKLMAIAFADSVS